MPAGHSWSQALRDLSHEVTEDDVSMGAAGLAFYLMLAIFPALIALLTLLPYLPVADLQTAIVDFLRQVLPRQAADLLTGTVQSIVSQRRGGLLTFGIVAAVWSASAGMSAIMRQLNHTYDVKEGRSFIKRRAIALGLTLLFAVLIVGAFSLIVFGGAAQAWLLQRLDWSAGVMAFFTLLRWAIIAVALLAVFALTYYFGPDVEQRFRFITPGSVFGVVLLALGAVGFRIYVANFAKLSNVYGSLGAVIILLMWLYLVGWVILLGSEINALVEHYSAGGKVKGMKREANVKGHALRPSPLGT